MPNKPETPEIFRGEIKVASRIVDYLSSGLYPSPAACLKELINNAYDADAVNVRVYVKPDADRIVIEDDGHGMSKEDFIKHFSRVSESHKRDSSDQTASKRPKIGKIGIGFIAANEICEVMEIFSTKVGSTELLHVTINFSEMTKPLEERRRNGDIVKADYEGEILLAAKDDHYTHIFLESVRGEARNILAGAASQGKETASRSLYGKSAETIVDELKSPSLKSWKDFDFYSETMLKVALNIPVQYATGWIPEKLANTTKELEKAAAKLNFNVYYDGTELRKSVVFAPGDKKCLVVPFNFDGKHVKAKGYIFAQHGSVKPQEMHGLLVRIRNSAVGEFDPSFWGFTPSTAPLIQRWVSAEIWADDGLEEAMNIDRSTLREAHPAYVELREELHRTLNKVFGIAKKQLYDAGSIVRKKANAKLSVGQLSEALDTLPQISTRAIKQINSAWSAQTSTPAAAIKKYSVTEFYKLVVEASDGVLSPEQLEKLLKRLTERLTQWQ